jgi:hypothetical protein
MTTINASNEMLSRQDIARLEMDTLTEQELDGVSGGMLTQFTYGDTSILVWANSQAHAVIVAKCSCS